MEKGNESLFNGHMINMATMPIYNKNFEKSFLWNQ